MSRAAQHNKLREISVEGSLICTVQIKGCDVRHGPAALINKELGFAPCPACIRNKVERAGMTPKETRYEKLKKRALEEVGGEI